MAGPHDIAEKLQRLNDADLETLRHRASRISCDAGPRRRNAEHLLPLIKAEIFERQLRKTRRN
jgi:hypothetical protein